MKQKLWLLQLPLVVLFTFAFYVDELGVQGKLQNSFLRERVFPGLRRVSTQFTDLKFKIRGPQKPKNKIIVVGVDSWSVEVLGRWPWHRDTTASLISSIFDAGAKAVGLDMVFSEPDKRVPENLLKVLLEKNMGDLALQAETDRDLKWAIAKNSKKLVLGWTTDAYCQPAYEEKEYCKVTDPEAIATHPPDLKKFAYSQFRGAGFAADKTPFISIVTLIPNMADYDAVADHAGYFNVWPDPDGYVRRMTLFMMAGGKPYPALALEMARTGLDDDLQLTLDQESKVRSLGFVRSGKQIPITPMGALEINFRGPSKTYPHVSAVDMLSDKPTLVGDEVTGTFVGANKNEVFKDAYVFIGPTAVGIYDMRAVPFDSNIAGVEVHANILDNLLSGDSLVNTSMSHGSIWIYLLMIGGALVWAYVAAMIEAVPALLLFLATFLGFGLVDTKLLFASNRNWNTSFLYLEMFAIFACTLIAKYILEERNKKFIRGAFTKYVAPAVVDQILKDPAKLTVGGEKRELTILFSDIRGFTTFSEKMDAKQLAALLNDYLGIMTKIVFEHEGTLDKYIGDAIMAFWGAPLEQAKHAANSAKTAVAMMKALNEHRERFKTQYGIRIDIGIGLNSGVVNVGNMGSESNFAYTVIGDHVNLASRLEGLTKAYGVSIVTSRYTFDSITACGEPLPPHRVLDRVKVKGKKQAVELIQILEREFQPEGLVLFEEGRKFYAEQRWDEAIQKFIAANEILSPADDPNAKDGPCEVYLERCRDFKRTPPGTEWDGSWEMHSK